MSEDNLESGFQLGDWTVLPRQSLLSREGESRHLEPRVMAVLVCLARHAPDTVTRDELFAEIWGRTVVQDEVLSRNISILRSQLGIDSGDQYIQTVPRVGYRLLMTPLQAGPAPTPADHIASVPFVPRFSKLAIATVTGIVLVIVLLALWRAAVDKPERSFVDTPGHDLRPEDVASVIKKTQLNTQLLLLGNFNVQRRGADFLQASIQLFDDALAKDARLIEAHLGLANAYALMPSYERSEAERMYAYALAELQAFVDKGGQVEETYSTEAFIHLQRMAWVEAEKRFTQAIQYNARDANLRQWYSQFLSRVGFAAASVKQAQLALELEPNSPVANHRLGVAYLWVGEDDSAAFQFAAAQRAGIAPFSNPEPRLILLYRQGRVPEMVSLLTAIQQSQRYSIDWVDKVGNALNNTSQGERALALSAVDSAWAADEIDPRLYFGIPLFLGAPDRALASATELLRKNRLASLVEGLFLPEAVAMRAEPAFAALVQELNLPAFWAQHGQPDVCLGAEAETAFCGRVALPQQVSGSVNERDYRFGSPSRSFPEEKRTLPKGIVGW